MTDTTRLPDASEDRVIECPVCSNTMTTMAADGVTVDVCAGGCSGTQAENKPTRLAGDRKLARDPCTTGTGPRSFAAADHRASDQS